MNIFGTLAKKIARTARKTKTALRAGLNAARTSWDTSPHWKGVFDQRTASGITPHDRIVVRAKAREEYENNPYAYGFAETFDLYTVGKGPELQFYGHELNKEWNRNNKQFHRWIELQWRKWASRTGLRDTLSLLVRMMIVDGASFALVSSNPKLNVFPASYEIIEPQRIANPGSKPNGRYEFGWLVDGFVLDDSGNIVKVVLLDVPNIDVQQFDANKFKMVDPEFIHVLTRRVLPGQFLGYSWFAPIIESFGRLRDTIAAVEENFKNTSSLIGYIESDYGYGDDYSPFGGLESVEPMFPYFTSEVKRNTWMQMPPKAKAHMLKPEQPVQGLWDIVSGFIAMMGRAIGLPRNKSTGSSHEYNFSSGQLDNQPFQLQVERMQESIKHSCLRPLFNLFYSYIYPQAVERWGVEIPIPDEVLFDFQFPLPPMVEPEAQARADAIAIKNGSTTPQRVWKSRHGDDMEDHLDEFIWAKENFPWLYGEKAEASGVTPEMTNTRINEPKIHAIENPTP